MLGEGNALHLQIASDLHVEFFQDLDEKIIIEPSAPYLALVGDIGIPSKCTYRRLLERESPKFKHIFVVAGNHEYYQGEYNEVQDLLKKTCSKFPNVTFLQKGSVWLPECGVRILGTTLWSHVPPEYSNDVSKALNDYNYIRLLEPGAHKARKITVSDVNSWHADELAWLQEEIQKAKDAGEKVVVLTHHAPSVNGTSHPRHKGSTINSAFSTDLEYLMGEHVKSWVFGHTHYSSDQKIRGTQVVSNQLGYALFNEAGGFRPDFFIKV
jgi:predicted phosphodiesterase